MDGFLQCSIYKVNEREEEKEKETATARTKKTLLQCPVLVIHLQTFHVRAFVEFTSRLSHQVNYIAW